LLCCLPADVSDCGFLCGHRFIDGIIALIHQVADDQQHEIRSDFATWLRSFAEHLETDSALEERVTEIGRQLLARIDVDALVKDVRRTMQPDALGFDGDRIARLIAQICRDVIRQRAIVADFNERLSFALASRLSGARLRLSMIVEGVVRAWDARFMTEKLELKIGRALQFIRLNGILVGGLAGLVLRPLPLPAGID
jgi:uncharacterized membrane-anchored protein YjiN (DUF445 family)